MHRRLDRALAPHPIAGRFAYAVGEGGVDGRNSPRVTRNSRVLRTLLRSPPATERGQ